MKKDIPLATAINIANRFKEVLKPHCSKIAVAGSVRRMKPSVGDIELVVVPNEPLCLNEVFPKDYPGIKKKGDKMKQFFYPQSGIQIDLYITDITQFGRILAIRTGSSVFSHMVLAVQWNRLGWCGTPDGLRRKKECIKKGSTWRLKEEYQEKPTLPPAFETEEAFFSFLKLEWTPPNKRSWTSQHDKINYAT